MSTIVAIASSSGSGAIALIRVSGPDAIRIVDEVFEKGRNSGMKTEDPRPKTQDRKLKTEDRRPKTQIGGKSEDLSFRIEDERVGQRFLSLEEEKGWTLHFGRILDGERELDEVVVSLFRAPRSYTGEDLVEISCHGSVYIQQEIVQLLIRKGAKMASPGEFTQRAFLNGKLDLSQAEAVADLIASSSKASHQLAMDQMRGGFSSEISELRSKLLELVSLIELELDFSEEDVEFADRSVLRNIIASIHWKVSSLTQSFQLGNVLKNGVPVAIVGETNVGKSTLLNVLLKEDKAIVSDIAGTTRDVIEDTIHLEGVLFRFIDTAGLRHTMDTIENLGIERSYQQMDKARIVILVVDALAPEQQSLHWARGIAEKLRPDQDLIIAVNKSDYEPEAINRKNALTALLSKIKNRESKILLLSAKNSVGIKELESFLIHYVNLQPLEDHDIIVTNARHYSALVRVLEAVVRLRGGLDTGISGDFLSQDIREILHYLGEITGEISNDEVLGNIFRNFCIGK